MLVRNQWYVAAWTGEIGRELLARTVCGEPLVMFRREDGSVAALEDRCWHRLAPLSMGKLVGDEVECGYHGLVFNGAGACVRMPNGGSIPPAACVRSYPVVERHRFVWVWVGEAERADPDLIPDLPWNDHPDWVGEGGRLPVKADYRLLIDNLMDLTHETYLHPETIGHDALSAAPIDTESDAGSVTVTRWTEGIDPPPFWKMAIGREGLCDRWQFIRFMPPAAIAIDVGVALAGTGARGGDRSQGVTGFVINFLTPETETTSHYFWNFVRDFDRGNAALTWTMTETTTRVFMQDVTMLEAQQRALSAVPDATLRNLNIDAGGVRARRLIDRLHKQHQVPAMAAE